MKPALVRAVALFKELGWDGAAVTDVPRLPIGTAAEQREAKAGLASGPWGAFGEIRRNTYGWISAVDVSEDLLALFAVRVGVDARRAAQLLRRSPDEDVVIELVSARGPAFAERFVEHSRHWDSVTVRLVAALQLPVPQDLAYLRSWSDQVAATGTPRRPHDTREDLPDAVLRDRYDEHVGVAASVGVPVPGSLRTCVQYGLAQGLLTRPATLEIAWSGLDAAQRPIDRKTWLDILLDDLHLTEDEIVARVDALIPILSTGEAALVEKLAPVLIARLPADRLGELAMLSLATTTMKTVRLVLKALATRGATPTDDLSGVAPRLARLSADRDAAVARLAAGLVASWGLAPTDAPPAPVPVGLWRPTPPVWTMPRFDRGDESPQALTELAAELVVRPAAPPDIVTERFLAVANAVAHRDPEQARSALRGATEGSLYIAYCWVKSSRVPIDSRSAASVIEAREAAVFDRLGDVPCLLSEPSWVDLSIDPEDLAARLEEYAKAGAVASEADLFLALTRLDVARADVAVRKRLERTRVPVLLLDGWRMREDAGRLASRYLADPLVEPGMKRESQWQSWLPTKVQIPGSLRPFPARLKPSYSWDFRTPFQACPTWGDAAVRSVSWNADVPSEKGLVYRQLARRRHPLTPGAAVNVLAGLRGAHPLAATDLGLAVVEAWERGLLQPGAADIRFLEWRDTLTAIGSFATVLADFAAEGLLSVAWPVLDDLLLAATGAPRLMAGASEVAEVMLTFAPEVAAALADGRAPAEAGAVPGVRALAARGGSSRAVTAATKVVAAFT